MFSGTFVVLSAAAAVVAAPTRSQQLASSYFGVRQGLAL